MAKKTIKKENQPKAVVENINGSGKTTMEMRMELKAKGVKQFRVMNKAELCEIINLLKTDLGEPGQNRISAIQKTAVERWKAGCSN